MTDTERYKYDVAFSFLHQDERLATEINDLIQDRFQTFLYSQRQEEIVGTDGEAKFGKVFRDEARIVVVLYREGWGKTQFTRVEEMAIRDRARDDGFGFSVFIPLDEPPTTPEWLDKSRIWMDLSRWGPQGAAAVIERRIAEAGGDKRPESVHNQVARLKRKEANEKRKAKFLNSESGVKAADCEFKTLISEIKRLCHEIQDPSADMVFDFQPEETYFSVACRYTILSLSCYLPSNSSLGGSKFSMKIREDTPEQRRIRASYGELRIKERVDFSFDCDGETSPKWHLEGMGSLSYSTPELAEYSLKLLLKHVSSAA